MNTEKKVKFFIILANYSVPVSHSPNSNFIKFLSFSISLLFFSFSSLFYFSPLYTSLFFVFLPFCFSSSDAQLEQNAKNRRPSLSPIVLRQLEQEQKAKMAASVDITQVMSKLSKQGKEAPPPPPPPAAAPTNS